MSSAFAQRSAVARTSIWSLLIAAAACHPSRGAAPPVGPGLLRAGRSSSGPVLAGDPDPGPPLAQVLSEATWHPLVWDLEDSRGRPIQVAMSLHWLSSTHADAGATARQMLRLRRAAFAQAHPPEGVVGMLATDTLRDNDLSPGPSLVVLTDHDRACVAKSDGVGILHHDPLGTEMEVVAALQGCGHSDWAPLAFAPQRLPPGLHWRPHQCADASNDDDAVAQEEAAKAHAADLLDEQIDRIVPLLQADEPLGIFGQWELGADPVAFALVSHGQWWVAIPGPGGSLVVVPDAPATADLAPCLADTATADTP